MTFPAPTGPLSDAITEGIRVEVMARHVAEQSRPQQGTWAFEYTVRITNLSDLKVQLISRHWIITDATETIKEVRGPGVVGKQPLLAPGESFQYSSWSRLETPTGSMRGTYQMQDERGRNFDIEIAPFALRAPYTVQ